MQIIRIEHPEDGLGVWRSCDSHYACRINKHSQHDIIEERHRDKTKFPSLGYDDELRAQLPENFRDYYFGFLSLEQLESGFTKDELKELINDLGFRVYCIEATEIITSQFQAMFNPKSITFKNDISFMFI